MKFRKNLAQVTERIKNHGTRNALTYLKRRVIAKATGLPNTIVFETASVCNLKCSFCYIVKAELKKGPGQMPLSTFKKVVSETGHFLQEVMLHWRGEPLLNKDLPAMVQFASQKGINSSLSTNGQLLTRDIAKDLISNRLTHLTVCVDGTTEEVYGLHRCGGSLELLLNNIDFLITQKKKAHSIYPKVVLQMIVTKKNHHQIEEFKKTAKKLDCDGAYLMSLFIDKMGDKKYAETVENEFYMDLKAEGLSRYFLDENGTTHLYNVATLCPQEARFPIITSGGELAVCCYDIFLKNTFGNCNTESFTSLWNAKKYVDFRNKIMMPRKLGMCMNCMPTGRKWTQKVF
jgi:MoaA/NifB/PqqE/SkfB family radical SAM enzyme